MRSALPLWRAFLRVLAWIFLFGFCYVLVATVAYGVPWAVGQDTVDRRLAALADVATAGGFLLAVLAVVVALLAYWQSIKRPRLALEVRVGDGTQEHIATLLYGSGTYRLVAAYPQSGLNVTLISKNDVSARNPAVKVTVLNGLTNLYTQAAGWSLGDGGAEGFKSAQWDGGADYLVHGGWQRQLPELPLVGSRLTEMDAAAATLQIQWVADGIAEQSKNLTIPLHH